MSTLKDKIDNEVFSQYFIVAEHWKSDVAFYGDELKFLSSLINKYFVYLLTDESLSEVRALAERISENTKTRDELEQLIVDYMADIKTKMTSHNEVHIRDVKTAHFKLEERITKFLKSYKDLKKNVFSMTEKILEKEKIKKLIGA